nr:sialidase-3-like isoform X3 [Labrus bergylta]
MIEESKAVVITSRADMGNKPSSHYEAVEDENTVFISKENDVFRIPALFYDRDRNILMAFSEKRKTSDDASAVALVMKTGTVNKDETTHRVTVKWSELKLVKEAHIKGYRPMNPCPLYEKNSKTLFLFFICVEGTVSELYQICCNRNKARLCYITTKDAGQSWSGVTDLTDKLDEIKSWATFAVGPGHGIQTEGGRLIVPVYGYASCSPSCCCCIKFYCCSPYALYLYSDDQGKSWQFSSRIQKVSLECEMAEVSDDTGLNSIYCNARSQGGHRVEALDKNDGAGFIILPPTDKLVETGTGCQGSVVSFPAQSEDTHADRDPSQNPNKWLLFTHPSNKSKRTDLGVYLNKIPSKSNAWSKPWIINKGPSAYSDLAYIDDGWFACLMERGEISDIEQIACKVFSYLEVKRGIGE